MFLQKVISKTNQKKNFFLLAFRKSLAKRAGSGAGSEAGSGSLNQVQGPKNPDPVPDPYQNVTDPEHCNKYKNVPATSSCQNHKQTPSEILYVQSAPYQPPYCTYTYNKYPKNNGIRHQILYSLAFLYDFSIVSFLIENFYQPLFSSSVQYMCMVISKSSVSFSFIKFINKLNFLHFLFFFLIYAIYSMYILLIHVSMSILSFVYFSLSMYKR